MYESVVNWYTSTHTHVSKCCKLMHIIYVLMCIIVFSTVIEARHMFLYTNMHTHIQVYLQHYVSGCFPRTRFKFSFTVVKPPLYCTGKWSCKMTCTSAISQLQLPCNGSTGQVPLPEHETFWRNTLYMFRGKFRVPGGGPDQLNRCKEAAAGSMLTCSLNCSFIFWYKTIGFLPPWSCTWVVFGKNSHTHL